jgi:hypothetical protein
MASFHLDARMVAQYEGEGWKAYYDRAWPRFLRLIVELEQAQFHIPFPASILAAYYVTRGAVVFVPPDHDPARVEAYLRRFYGLAQRYSGLKFDVAKAAHWEYRYWIEHRVLSGKPDKTAFIEAMTQLHATLFGLTPEQARESAELRVQANNVVDTITAHTAPDPAQAWTQIEDLLTRCYASIARQMESAAG